VKIGDLVRYVNGPHWITWIGIVIRQIPGTDRRQVVFWATDGQRTSSPERDLEVISESR